MNRLQALLVLRYLSALNMESNPFATGEIVSLKQQPEITKIFSPNGSFFSQSFTVKEAFKDRNYVTQQLNKAKKCQEHLSYT